MRRAAFGLDRRAASRADLQGDLEFIADVISPDGYVLAMRHAPKSATERR